MLFSIVGFWPTGRLSQTKYHLKDSPSWVKITRSHHPLQQQQLEVLNVGPKSLVVRLRDGSTMKIPRLWTDIDGVASSAEMCGSETFTLEAFRELIELIDNLKRRC